MLFARRHCSFVRSRRVSGVRDVACCSARGGVLVGTSFALVARAVLCQRAMLRVSARRLHAVVLFLVLRVSSRSANSSCLESLM
jgi:hypothetical protein